MDSMIEHWGTGDAEGDPARRLRPKEKGAGRSYERPAPCVPSGLQLHVFRPAREPLVHDARVHLAREAAHLLGLRSVVLAEVDTGAASAGIDGQSRRSQRQHQQEGGDEHEQCPVHRFSFRRDGAGDAARLAVLNDSCFLRLSGLQSPVVLRARYRSPASAL